MHKLNPKVKRSLNRLTHSTLLATFLLMGSTALLINGCQSNIPEVTTTTHGSKAGDGYTYGTGPNKTRPYPQTEPVVIKGVAGATPRSEALSRGGNNDYTVLGQNYMVWTGATSYQEIGTASWYGPGFHGNNTSNGERYNQKGYTAAHKNLPLPSYVKVTNLENGKAVIVRVNDRGPFHGSRIIDLSEGAAKAIDMTKKGTAKVKLELIDTGNVSSSTASNSNSITKQIITEVIENNTSAETRDKLNKLGQLVESIHNSSSSSTGSSSSTSKGSSAGAIGTGILLAQTVGALGNNSNSYSSGSGASNSWGSKSSTNVLPPNSNNSTTNANSDAVRAAAAAAAAAKIASDARLASTNAAEQDLLNSSSSTTTTTPSKPNITTTTTTTQTYQYQNAPGYGKPFVQVFSSGSPEKAQALRQQLASQTPYPVLVAAEDGLYRVRIGPLSEGDAATVLECMKQLGYPDSFIKHVP